MPDLNTGLYIGLMSGTSLDGVDGVLAQFGSSAEERPTQIVCAAHLPFDADLYAQFLALQNIGHDEIHREALAGNALAQLYARCVQQLLDQSGIRVDQVCAIGAHGQTIRHQPGRYDGVGYTRQTLNPALLAELSGIDVITDLRSRDIAAGGQGAPLVPAFHHALFGTPGRTRVICNIGGFANLSILGAGGTVHGFDCGPGNVLLDHWARRHLGQPYDAGGQWAASGKIETILLQRLRDEPFFAKTPPKSTGRDLFDERWLDRMLEGFEPLPASNIQATLAELSAVTIATDVSRHAPKTEQMLVCGGGALNADLMQRLQRLLKPIQVHSTQTVGIPPDHVEALAFAWLARRFAQRQPGNLPAVTGAHDYRILGALYPA